MPLTDPASLERIVESVLQSARYRHIYPDVVRRIAEREISRRKTWKEAEKETRSRLHQIAGAYLESVPPYSKWLETLKSAPDADAYRLELRRMMQCHASTRERLPMIDTFYERTLASIRPIRSILDIACGFNPLAVPWMGLVEGASYFGFDLYGDMMLFGRAATRASTFAPSCTVETEARDLAVSPPQIEADVALVLKFLPLLEQAGVTDPLGWLRGLKTRYALISFPTRTLGGRNVGMANSYSSRLTEILEQANWRSERIEMANELCFLVEL